MNALIIDDEEKARLFLAALLKRNHPEINCHYAASHDEAMKCLSKNEYDLLFLDIEMPDTDGLTLLEKIRSKKNEVLVCIVSAFPDFEYAQQALKLEAFDYIVKPVSRLTLTNCIEKAKEKIGFANSNQFQLPYSQGDVFINIKDVVFAKSSARNRIEITLSDGKKISDIYLPLSKIVEKSPANFIQISRQHLVNANFISVLNTKNRTLKIRLKDGKTEFDFRCSRGRIAVLTTYFEYNRSLKFQPPSV